MLERIYSNKVNNGYYEQPKQDIEQQDPKPASDVPISKDEREKMKEMVLKQMNEMIGENNINREKLETVQTKNKDLKPIETKMKKKANVGKVPTNEQKMAVMKYKQPTEKILGKKLTEFVCVEINPNFPKPYYRFIAKCKDDLVYVKVDKDKVIEARFVENDWVLEPEEVPEDPKSPLTINFGYERSKTIEKKQKYSQQSS